MNRIENIILNARDTLADPDNDRWSDKLLVRLIDEAQKDICKRARLLRNKSEATMANNSSIIILPDDLLLLDRVTYEGVPIPIKSHREMDRLSADWENHTGDAIKTIVFDKLNRGNLKAYPIPTNLETEPYTINSDYGIVTAIDGLTSNSPYGLVTNTTQGGYSELMNSYNGVVTNIEEYVNVLEVYYIRKPSDVVSVNSLLEIDDSFDSAIKYYITGKALRNDMDTQNRLVGNEELNFYDRELKEAMSDDFSDFSKGINYEVPYIGAFN